MIYVTLFVTAQLQWRRKSQWASSIFTAFHALMSSTKKKHLGVTENRNFQEHQKNQMGQAINAATTKKHKPAWTAGDPLKTTSGRTHEIRKEFEWHTHRLEYNPDFSAWDVVFLNSMDILDVTIQARKYFAERHLTHGDPEYVSRVSLVIHCLQLGLSHESAWMPN